jgi:hypothetical protein
MSKKTPCTLETTAVSGLAYHGTNVAFDEFDDRLIGTSTDAGTLGTRFYFSSLYSAALSNAEWVVWKKGEGTPIVKAARLLICRPYYVTRANAPRNLENDPRAAKRFTQSLLRQGYDGVIHTMDHRNIGGGLFHEYVVYYSKQILLER